MNITKVNAGLEPDAESIDPPLYQDYSNGVELIDVTENLTANAARVVQLVAEVSRIDHSAVDEFTYMDIIKKLRQAEQYLAREISRVSVLESGARAEGIKS